MTAPINRKLAAGKKLEESLCFAVFVDPDDGSMAILRRYAGQGAARSFYNRANKQGHVAELYWMMEPACFRFMRGEELPAQRRYEVRWQDVETGAKESRLFRWRSRALEFIFEDRYDECHAKQVGYYEDGTLYVGWEVAL